MSGLRLKRRVENGLPGCWVATHDGKLGVEVLAIKWPLYFGMRFPYPIGRKPVEQAAEFINRAKEHGL